MLLKFSPTSINWTKCNECTAEKKYFKEEMDTAAKDQGYSMHVVTTLLPQFTVPLFPE